MSASKNKIRRRRAASRERGMTLIEMLIVVALSAIVIIAVLEIYAEGQKYFFNQNSRADAIEEIRTDMARISRDIRDATNISNTATDYNGQDYTTNNYCLILEVPSIDGAGLTIAGSFDSIVDNYDETENRLLKIVTPGGGVRQNQTQVMAIDLARPDPSETPFNLKYFNWDGTTPVTSAYEGAPGGAYIVELELTAQGRAIHRGGRPWIETFRTQAKLRNKIGPE